MAPPTPAASLKVRPIPYKSGSQVNSNLKLTSSKPYKSFDEAVRNGSYVYKQNGQTYIIKKVKEGNVWSLRSQTEAAHGRAIRQNTNSGRRQRSSAAYNTPPAGSIKPVVNSTADQKISRINRRNQQFHHIMDLDGYKHIFAGLDPKGIQQLKKLLNAKGFFPGDDRRNYIGLVGSNVRKGSEHQGQVHPLTYRYRKDNPIPTVEQLRGLNPIQRLQTLLPQLQAERAILQQVVKDNRRNSLSTTNVDARTRQLMRNGYGLEEGTVPKWASRNQMNAQPLNNPLFNAANGGIESQTNDYVQELPTSSPFLLKLAN